MSTWRLSFRRLHAMPADALSEHSCELSSRRYPVWLTEWMLNNPNRFGFSKVFTSLNHSTSMDGEGFEPSKALPTDLQSAPFGHSGIHPGYMGPIGLEPMTLCL